MAAKIGEATHIKGAPADKRQAILDAALDLFRNYGYRRTSMEDIAQAAGVAKGTLYLYFKSKDELFEALARQLAEQVDANVQAAAARDLEVEEKIIAILEAKLGFMYCWILSSPHAAEFIHSKQQLSQDVFGPVDQRFRAALARALRDGVKLGEFDPRAAGLSIEAAADTVIAAAYGAEMNAKDETEFNARLRRIVKLALRGLRPLA